MKHFKKTGILTGLVLLGYLNGYSQDGPKKVYKITSSNRVVAKVPEEVKDLSPKPTKVYSCNLDKKNKKVTVSHSESNGEIKSETYDLIDSQNEANIK